MSGGERKRVMAARTPKASQAVHGPRCRGPALRDAVLRQPLGEVHARGLPRGSARRQRLHGPLRNLAAGLPGHTILLCSEADILSVPRSCRRHTQPPTTPMPLLREAELSSSGGSHAARAGRS
jgi:hypothetical protein